MDRVTDYAVVVTGPSFDKTLGAKYWAVNQRVQEMLNQFGYPHEAIYRFCEEGPVKGPGINGKSTLANIRIVFGHLAKIMEKGDRLVVFLVGHASPFQGDFACVLNDGRLTGAELKALLDAVPARTSRSP